MQNTLEIIKQSKNYENLMIFLQEKYPFIIVKEPNDNEIFKNYKPWILTFPHRKILDEKDANKAIIDLEKRSIYLDYLIKDGKCYIEYLKKDEEAIIDSIPDDNWFIKKYKKENRVS